MNKTLYLIVILALVITTISQTVSFIVGDHQFYQIVQDKCTKCHGDIQIQLSASDQHSNFSCVSCHVRSATNHTNKIPECSSCHTNQHLNDTLEAHPEFSSMGSEGCVTCHSTYNVIVNYSRPEYIDYTIKNDNGDWIVSDFKTQGTLNLSYDAMRQGGKHNMKNVSCRDCHKDIFDAVSLGGHGVVLSKNGTQVPYHNNSNYSTENWCRTCHNKNDTKFQTQQHSARKTTCEECHESNNLTAHPGNFYTTIKTVPHLYQSLVCISCKSAGWPAPNTSLSFKVHEEPYYDVAYQTIIPLNITDASPTSDPITQTGVTQIFSVTLNRFADVIWCNNGSEVFRVLGVISSTYTGSSRTPGVYNITTVAQDNYNSASRIWIWNVTNESGGGGGVPGGGGGSGGAISSSINGYVFDNFGSPLSGVLVNGSYSYENTTSASGYYSITNITNGIYNFSYSKAGFNTEYFIFTLGGIVMDNMNMTIYDTTPPNSVSNPNSTTDSFFINNTWVNPSDIDFNNTLFRYSNNTTLWSVNKSTSDLNLTWSPHYTQNISAQTVDNYSNENQTKIWFNISIPDNPPVQAQIGNKTISEGQWLNFIVNTSDIDNDTITYDTNATKGTLNTTTGQFSWIPGYGDAGVYFWYFNSSDGYGAAASENITVTVNNISLLITNSTPASDPTTAFGTVQTFEIILNRTADIIWYNNGAEAFRALGVLSANYTNSSAGIGIYNITTIANDGFDSVSMNWTWNVTNGSGGSGGGDGGGGSGGSNNSISGYVFDKPGTALPDVLVQNNTYQDNASASGFYSITNFPNGTYNFSYSKAGFNTGYFEFTFNGAVIVNANKTLYDNTPPASVSGINVITGNFFIKNTWVSPDDADFNYTWFRYSNDTTLQSVSKNSSDLNLTWSPHYTQKISAQTVDVYGNTNQTKEWFNATIPNNVPLQSLIGNKTINEGDWLNFTVNAIDVDNDTITYGTNATKGQFNTMTGNFTWETTFADSGTYVGYFNSIDSYGGIANETITVTVNNVPLSITSSLPVTDPVTTQGTAQDFNITLNRTANIIWYINGYIVQNNLSVLSADYSNSTAGVGLFNVTVIANDIYDSVSRMWNWTVN